MLLRSSREETIALFHRARMEARLRGAARLIVREGEDPELDAEGSPSPIRAALGENGVSLEIEGERRAVEFAYGPLGIAHLASATLTLRRGALTTEIVVSGYGRVRR
jgi:hypothetical protein